MQTIIPIDVHGVVDCHRIVCTSTLPIVGWEHRMWHGIVDYSVLNEYRLL
jgi:hypothetical protein